MPDAHLFWIALVPPRRRFEFLFAKRARRRYLQVCLAATALAACACASSPTTPPAAPARPPDAEAPARSAYVELYEAIGAEFEARGWPVAVASEPFLTTATAFEPLSARLRKRRVARVLKLPRGGALKVVVEHQRDVGPPGEPRWEPTTPTELEAQIAAEELELGRAIEARFHRARRR